MDEIIKKLKQTYNNINEQSNLLEETIKIREKSITNIISGSSSKEYQSIDNQTFKQAVDFYFSKKMGIRDLTIFILCCCYGLERNKVQKLKWSEILIGKNNSYINLNGRNI